MTIRYWMGMGIALGLLLMPAFADPARGTLLPGTGVAGWVQLEQKGDTVVTALGAPDNTQEDPRTRIYLYDKLGFKIVTTAASQWAVTNIFVSSPDYKTDKGLHVGSTMQDVQTAYGAARSNATANLGGQWYSGWGYPGIIFLTDENHKPPSELHVKLIELVPNQPAPRMRLPM